MLPRNSKLAGQIAKSLKGMPKSQRSTAILAFEDYYKHVEGKSFNIHSNTAHLEKSERKVKWQNVKLYDFDPEMMKLLSDEAKRQKKSVDLIASSNIPIPEMNEITTHLSNKSSPGFPDDRHFNGDQYIDKVERLCYDRALKAFNLYPDEWKVNVQTLSGSLANLCAYHSQLKPGETVLSLNAKTGGGHFTHGLEDENENGTNLYGQVWNFKHYGLDEEGHINYDEAQEKALQYRPKLIVCGASTHSRDIDYARF